MNANLLRHWTKPGSWYRNLVVIGGGQQQFNFDGDQTDLQFHSYMGGQLKNYWNVSMYGHFRPEVDDDRLTRGGAVVRRASSWFFNPSFSSDSRKAVVLSAGTGFGGTSEGGRSMDLNATVRIKPATNVQLTFGPSFSQNRGISQFVRRYDDPSATDFFGQRAVFAGIEQRTLSLTTRLNWTFTPDLTLELFAQPFVAAGEYDAFKEFVRPRGLEKREFDAVQLTPVMEDGRVKSYVLDPDRDAATENFTFGNPDFNVRSLRGNAVLRWEYRPGSTLFFVWQQERSGSAAYGDFSFDRDAAAVFRQHPDNIFVIKASYWLGR
jgi:hypothetical protein